MFNRINNRLDTAEQMITEPEAIAIETHQNEITKDERLKNMNSALLSCGTSSRGLIYILLKSLKKRGEGSTKKYYEETVAQFSQMWWKTVNPKFQEAEKKP